MADDTRICVSSRSKAELGKPVQVSTSPPVESGSAPAAAGLAAWAKPAAALTPAASYAELPRARLGRNQPDL
jgi:hypothetical protein